MRRLSMSLLALAAVLAATLAVFSFLENGGGGAEFSEQPFLFSGAANEEGTEAESENLAPDGESGSGANEASDGRGISSLSEARKDVGEIESSSPFSEVIVEGCGGGEVRLSGIEARLFELHNEERGARDISSLCVREELVESSRIHSEDMIEHDYFAHETPEDVDAFERMERAGYTLDDGYSSIKTGENLAWRTQSGPEPELSDAELVVEGWLESEGHRRNLLDPEFREVGIGAATGEYKDYEQPATMYTVNFGVRE
ncbi:MAG: CAP domain-containing protein [Actinomycetota bacterium]|nr:CAP domain-containing protein [Rubrobacter sp.]MDQ3509563.1 CAP domain-containing protein [Actinomycetota bacterium]